jgi:two-component system LytT family sensor kinase
MTQSYIVLGRLLDNKYRLIHHILFVGLILSFWFLFTINRPSASDASLKTILYSSTYIAIAYFNIYFLFKRFLLQGKILAYVAVSIVTFVLSYITQGFIYFKSWEQLRTDFTPSVALFADMMINAITYCMFIGIGLSVKMIKMWMNSERRISSLEQENLKAKLNNLRSQISPHFLFNTFNNLYVLTKTNPKIASEMILGFADLMRYQLNESDKEKVNVEKEINYIENFLSLEKLRKDKLDLKISYDKISMEGVKIEPLLFVTLIENAVKHGSQQMENPFIHIHLERKNELFYIEVTNSKPEVSLLGKEESLGKGIDNLKKRLSLSYPLKHTLELIEQKTVFTAKLKINLE